MNLVTDFPSSSATPPPYSVSTIIGSNDIPALHRRAMRTHTISEYCNGAYTRLPQYMPAIDQRVTSPPPALHVPYTFKVNVLFDLLVSPRRSNGGGIRSQETPGQSYHRRVW